MLPMSAIPVTSVSLLKAVSSDAQHARWGEFYAKYEGLMRAFLIRNYPSLEPEDVIQETMLALMKALPNYEYLPDEKGHFHNYLMGILKHKAQDALSRRVRESKTLDAFKKEPRTDARAPRDDKWKKAAMEVALTQLLADKTINPLHRTVFRHLVLLHETPNAVAEKFGTSRTNVDVIKKRMIARLSTLIARLTAF